MGLKESDVPQLNAAWWKKAKPLLYKDPGLGDALKDWEIAEDSMDVDKRTKAISDLKKMLGTVVVAMGKKDYDTEVTVLKKMTKLILAEELKTKEMASRPVAKEVPKQKMGSSVTIWERDISAEVLKKVKPDWLKDFKGYKLAMTLNGDILDVFEEEDDAVTPAFIAQDAEEIGQKLILTLVGMINDIEKASKGKKPQEVDKLREGFKAAADKAIKEVGKGLEAIPQQRWDKFVKQKQQYKDYKIKAGLNLTIGVLSVGGAAAGIVGSGGAALALGIVALVRSSAAVIKQIRDLAVEAETIEKNLKKDLETLKERYISATGDIKSGKLGATEITGTVLKSILGVDPPFIQTIPKCTNYMSLWQNKVAGITVEGRKLWKDVSAGLKQCDKLEAMIKNAENKEARKLFDKLVKARKALTEALEDCTKMNARVDKAEKNFAGIDQMLKALQAATPKYVEIFDKVFPVVVNLTLSGASGGVGLKEAENTLQTFNAALGLFNDVANEGRGVLEEVLG